MVYVPLSEKADLQLGAVVASQEDYEDNSLTPEERAELLPHFLRFFRCYAREALVLEAYTYAYYMAVQFPKLWPPHDSDFKTEYGMIHYFSGLISKAETKKHVARTLAQEFYKFLGNTSPTNGRFVPLKDRKEALDIANSYLSRYL